EHEFEHAIENEILSAIRVWLEPLQDGSLPNYNIQKEMFHILSRVGMDTLIESRLRFFRKFTNACVCQMTEKQEIQQEHLQSSKIGRIVNFYTKCARVNDRIKGVAQKLLETWSRPVLNRSANPRTREVLTMQYSSQDRVERQRSFTADRPPQPRQNPFSDDRAAKNDDDDIKRARIPQRVAPNFSIVPENIIDRADVDKRGKKRCIDGLERKQAPDNQFTRLASRLKQMTQKASRQG
ncbi:Transcription factor iws1, partial [Rhizophlyctis rosea]